MANCRAPRCKNTRRRNSEFCRRHHGRYEIRMEPCTGEAHKPEVGGMIDNCMVCMPRWGTMEVPYDTWRCVYHDKAGRRCIRVAEHHGYCSHLEPHEPALAALLADEKGQFDVG